MRRKAKSVFTECVKGTISSLLKLQEKDIALASLRGKLSAIPAGIAALKREADEAEGHLNAEREAFAQLEKKRAQMRAERRAVEEKISKYKSQLPEVKKNDDYSALSAEIDRMLSAVSAMEEEELKVLFDIDSKRESLNSMEEAAENLKESIKGKMESVAQSGRELELRVADALAERDSAASEVPPDMLAAYEKLRDSGKKQPLVVPLKGDLCGGCFLKVSGEVESKLKEPGATAICEQCGRIIYLD